MDEDVNERPRHARFVQHQPQTQQNNTRPDALDTRDTCVSRHGLAPKCVSWCFVSVSAFPLSAILVWPMPRWSLLSAAPRISPLARCSRRWLFSSSPASTEASHDRQPAQRWGDTLLLPKTTFPLYNDPSKDPKIRQKTSEDLYRWQVGVHVHRSASSPLTLNSIKTPTVPYLSSLTVLRMRTVTSTWVSVCYYDNRNCFRCSFVLAFPLDCVSGSSCVPCHCSEPPSRHIAPEI